MEVLRSLNFTPQRLQPEAKEKNPAAKAAWLRWLWPAIKQSALRRGGLLVFLDETGLLLTPLVRIIWAPRGKTPKLEQVMGERKHLGWALLVRGSVIRNLRQPLLKGQDPGKAHRHRDQGRAVQFFGAARKS